MRREISGALHLHSTRDDRVHPGHARKLAAKLEQCGDKFYYDEAIEGGHAAGIVPEEDAQRAALEAVYLNLVLRSKEGRHRHEESGASDR